MTLQLTDKWVWDFWFAQDGPNYHVFYLQAPRSLGDETLRHWNVSIGHAVSTNLGDWQLLPDALAPSATPAWDDKSTWTGSIIKHNDLWYMFYTGTSQADQGLIQRIGLATSPDLITWQRHPHNPLIQADSQWYETLDLTAWGDEAWRDPWLFQHPETGDFHAFITGRIKAGPADERGVIAHARSQDLIHWDVLPPLTTPGDFGQMEVSQLVHIAGRYYLIFCTSIATTAASRPARIGLPAETGTHYLVADNPLGPFHYITDQFLVGDITGSLYSGKLVQGPDGNWYFMAFHLFRADGEFIGTLSNPYPVEVEATTGKLKILIP